MYCDDCHIAAPAAGGEENAGAEAYAFDRDAAARLWTVSAELTGVDAFAMA